jgi:hypothetical protein
LSILGSAIAGNLQCTLSLDKGLDDIPVPRHLLSLIPYMLTISKEFPHVIHVGSIDSRRVEDVLLKEYGDGIYQIGAFGKAIPTKPQYTALELAVVFDEFECFSLREGRVLELTNNPYLLLLLDMPLQHKAFFAGATHRANYRQTDSSGRQGFTAPLRFRDIFGYADLVGELMKAGEYFEMYKRLGQ